MGTAAAGVARSQANFVAEACGCPETPRARADRVLPLSFAPRAALRCRTISDYARRPMRAMPPPWTWAWEAPSLHAASRSALDLAHCVCGRNTGALDRARRRVGVFAGGASASLSPGSLSGSPAFGVSATRQTNEWARRAAGCPHPLAMSALASSPLPASKLPWRE